MTCSKSTRSRQKNALFRQGLIWLSFDRPEITPIETATLREKYEVAEDETLLLSLSRVSYEKNIQAVIAALPDVLKVNPKVKLIVAGDGPYLDDLKKQAAKLGISDAVVFTGMIPPNETALYYKAADFFISVFNE